MHAHVLEEPYESAATYPVRIDVPHVTENRNRMTTAFRILLAIPHMILVGGPVATLVSIGWTSETGWTWEWSSGPGALGAVALVAAMISWFAILATTVHPQGLWNLGAFYLRWRVRALAYVTLLRDEFPPFGDGEYPVTLEVVPPVAPRDRVSVGFRVLLAMPHLIALWALGIAWALTTMIAWFVILFTGRYPPSLYAFAAGVLRWGARVEAYLLLLRDEYPPFTLE